MKQEIGKKILRMYKLGYTIEQLSLIFVGEDKDDIKKVIKEEENENE